MRTPTPRAAGSEPVTLVTGGCGFVGTNVARRELEQGRRVNLFDNLSRSGVAFNFRSLKARFGDRVELTIGDVRDAEAVRQAVLGADRVVHLAAQVAVTTSLTDPVADFEVNARGTLNVLEALRRMAAPPPLLFTSTNKVYGDLADVEMVERSARVEPKEILVRSQGVGEDRPLDFHSPYGVSKGTADQYVLDYARSFGLPAVVFRMSCVYGPNQFGTEDQGWVAHFAMQALQDQPITIYGDGKQVRDLLFVEDLVEAIALALERIDSTRGSAFNIGGGPDNAASLLELIASLEKMTGAPIERRLEESRVGDQRYYVSDTARFRAATGWAPAVGVTEGVRRLAEWILAESPLVCATRALTPPGRSYARNVTVR